MQRIFNAVLIGLGVGLTGLIFLVIFLTPEKKYNYVIAFPDGSQALYEAHAVKPVNFCSEFINNGRVTAIVCGTHSVVQKEISVVRPSAEAAPADHSPVGGTRSVS